MTSFQEKVNHIRKVYMLHISVLIYENNIYNLESICILLNAIKKFNEDIDNVVGYMYKYDARNHITCDKLLETINIYGNNVRCIYEKIRQTIPDHQITNDCYDSLSNLSMTSDALMEYIETCNPI